MIGQSCSSRWSTALETEGADSEGPLHFSDLFASKSQEDLLRQKSWPGSSPMPFPLEWIETLLNLKPKEILPRASSWCLKGTTSDKWYAFAPQSPPTLLSSDAGSQPCQRPQCMSICILSHHPAKHPQRAASNGDGLTQARVLDNTTFPNPRCPRPCIKVKLGPGPKWDQPRVA